MSCFNHIHLVGRLTATPELRKTGTGIPVANFTLAVNHYRPDSNDEFGVDFIDHVAWRGLAEKAAGKYQKGDMVIVDGELRIREYTDDGGRHWRPEVVVDTMSKLTSPSSSSPEGE